MTDIINKVANSGLITIDAIDYYPQQNQYATLDLKDWLFHGLILKEADFRDTISKHEWAQYQDLHLRIYCSTEAIIPKWAYMLIASQVSSYHLILFYGNEASFIENIWILNLKNAIHPSDYIDKRVVIKGCGEVEVSENIYMYLVTLLQPVVKSLMFGEPCSTVPVYKKPKESINLHPSNSNNE
jgi:hypothetical protein